MHGLLAAACNFIPYVGFIIGVVPPALLALLGGGWRLMIIVIIAYILLNSLFTSLLPPYVVGDAVGMSITVTLISVVFWDFGCSAIWARYWPSAHFAHEVGVHRRRPSSGLGRHLDRLYPIRGSAIIASNPQYEGQIP